MTAQTLPAIEMELRQFLEAVSGAVQQFGAAPGDIAGMRQASAEARLPWQAGGPEVDSEDVWGLGMPTHLFRPKGVARPRLLIYLHGGGWTMLSVRTHERLLREYVAASGRAVLAPDYPLAPEMRFPRALEALSGFLDAVRDRAPALDLNLDQLVLGGDSSGANLALALALANQGPRLGGLLLNYGVYDADPSRPSYAAFGDAPHLLNAQKMAFFWNNYCLESEARHDIRAAPLRASLSALGRLPPCCLVIADQDVLVDENLAMARRLDEAGVDHRVYRYPRATHAFLEAISVSPSARDAVDRSAAWMAELGEAVASRESRATAL